MFSCFPESGKLEVLFSHPRSEERSRTAAPLGGASVAEGSWPGAPPSRARGGMSHQANPGVPAPPRAKREPHLPSPSETGAGFPLPASTQTPERRPRGGLRDSRGLSGSRGPLPGQLPALRGERVGASHCSELAPSLRPPVFRGAPAGPGPWAGRRRRGRAEAAGGRKGGAEGWAGVAGSPGSGSRPRGKPAKGRLEPWPTSPPIAELSLRRRPQGDAGAQVTPGPGAAPPSQGAPRRRRAAGGEDGRPGRALGALGLGNASLCPPSPRRQGGGGARAAGRRLGAPARGCSAEKHQERAVCAERETGCLPSASFSRTGAGVRPGLSSTEIWVDPGSTPD